MAAAAYTDRGQLPHEAIEFAMCGLFDWEAIPDRVHGLVQRLARHYAVDPVVFLYALTAGAASLLGTHANINDNLHGPTTPNLFFLLVGPSLAGKSSASDFMVKAFKHAEVLLSSAEAARKKTEGGGKKTSKHVAAGPTLVITDATPEGVRETMALNNGHVFLAADEATGTLGEVLGGTTASREKAKWLTVLSGGLPSVTALATNTDVGRYSSANLSGISTTQVSGNHVHTRHDQHLTLRLLCADGDVPGPHGDFKNHRRRVSAPPPASRHPSNESATY